MARLERVVDRNQWILAEALGPRRERLLNVPAPTDLLGSIVAESMTAAEDNRLTIAWQESCERLGHFRLVGQVPLTETNFDQLFNGRSGYRAQYYLSPEEGVLYNRAIISGLAPAIRAAFELRPLQVDWALVEQSVAAPHSKIWVFREREAFEEAAPDTLNPRRWVENSATMGRRAPLPAHRCLDIKGAFVNPDTGALFIDDLKLERPCDIFQRGFS
jgi:hypothetical protein